MNEPVEGWDGATRRDGARIVQGESGGWIIPAFAGLPEVLLCPCCDRLMLSQRGAKLVCNQLHPLEP
jgi:hypothetical protein